MLPFVSRKITFWLKSNNNQKNVAGRQPNCWDSLQLEGRKRVNVSAFFPTNTIPISVRVCHHHLVAQKFVSPILMSG